MPPTRLSLADGRQKHCRSTGQPVKIKSIFDGTFHSFDPFLVTLLKKVFHHAFDLSPIPLERAPPASREKQPRNQAVRKRPRGPPDPASDDRSAH
jgi:hypothetical protein